MVGPEHETHARALANLRARLSSTAEGRALFDALLGDEGLGPDALSDGSPEEGWIPLAANLRILHRVGEALGEDALFEVGRTVPEHARFPPDVCGAAAALASIDVAFHMNHRKRGVVLFDPATRTTHGGIGHYHVASLPDRRVMATVTGVYPCAFDRGLLTGVARRFEPAVEIAHPAHAPCRSRGQQCCVYYATW